MNNYLVTFSVGPVQGFISSARRSRDLWSGSWLLSELAKACAKSLREQGATLIFPHVEDDDNEALKSNSDFSVGNKIQVIIKADDLAAVKVIANNAKAAAQARFKVEVDNAERELSSYTDQIRNNIWKTQITDYLEIQWAWAKVAEGDYAKAVQNVGRVLASRKATRDFTPSAISPYHSDYMIPKSSLDGTRETVLEEDKELKESLRKKLSLAKSEQLDVAGVVKRLGFEDKAEQFTPFTRVAAHAWLEKIATKEPDALEKLKYWYKEAVGHGIATRVTGNKGAYGTFPYDAQLLYPSRMEVESKKYQKPLHEPANLA